MATHYFSTQASQLFPLYLLSLILKCQLYGYCEIDPDGRNVQWRSSPYSRTYENYEPHADDKFKLLLLNSPKDIWPAFKKLFGGERD